MQTLIFLSVAVSSYYLMCILQAVLHRTHGHRKRIWAVFEAHAIRHHAQYPANRLQSETFMELESHALYYYGIPIVFAAAAIYLQERLYVSDVICSEIRPIRNMMTAALSINMLILVKRPDVE